MKMWSSYAGMAREDKDALIAAMKQIPAVEHPVAPSEIK